MEAAARDTIDLKIFAVSEVRKIQITVQQPWESEITKSASTSNNLHAGKENIVFIVAIPNTSHQSASIKALPAIAIRNLGTNEGMFI